MPDSSIFIKTKINFNRSESKTFFIYISQKIFAAVKTFRYLLAPFKIFWIFFFKIASLDFYASKLKN